MVDFAFFTVYQQGLVYCRPRCNTSRDWARQVQRGQWVYRTKTTHVKSTLIPVKNLFGTKKDMILYIHRLKPIQELGTATLSFAMILLKESFRVLILFYMFLSNSTLRSPSHPPHPSPHNSSNYVPGPPLWVPSLDVHCHHPGNCQRLPGHQGRHRHHPLEA